MLNDAKMMNNGDGTVTFEFRMDADDVTEIAVLKRFMSCYEECVNVLREYYMGKNPLHTCEVCGKPSSISNSTTDPKTGVMSGPHYYCDEHARIFLPAEILDAIKESVK